jgi:superfamily II DNA or RNA helicase
LEADPTVSSDGNPRWGDGAISVPLLRGALNDEFLELHLAAVEYTLATPITIRDRDDIKSAPHWSEHFTPFEHQVRNLITYCRRAPVALIADDVGLGKTISAGLILSELMTRKKVRRALILAPKLLLPQWCEELSEKFHIDARAASGSTLQYLLDSNVQVVVTTYDTARARMDDLKKSFFDMLILDEAHKLRNFYGGTNEPPKVAQVLHKALLERDFKYVVMLTATPIQNRLWDIYSLVDCLATARGHRNPLGAPGYFSAYYLKDSAATARELKPGRREEFRRHLGEYMVRTSRRDSNLVFPERHVKTFGCPPGAAEKNLAHLVSSTLPTLNALARSSLAEALMSSPAALVSQLRNMAANGTVPADVPEAAARLADESGSGCKLERLRALVREVSRENGIQWRVVVFTRRKETQALIGRVLGVEGVKVGFIEGGKAIANQRAIVDLRADPPNINLLVSTDAGAEGVNLQTANIVVNYDLPWNPMVVEQRIGRIQRLASVHKSVHVVNLVVAGSVEETVVARLIAKLQAISETIGDVEGILESSALDEDKFEETIRDLVIKALMGQDVAEATERINKSIERAKAAYDQEKGEVEKNLGALDAMHTAGPALPKLQDIQPRLSAQDFSLRALTLNGVAVVPTDDGRWLARQEGRSPIVVTFDEDDPDIRDDGLSGFHRRRAELYAEGRPAFERLVGEWSRRDSASLIDFRGSNDGNAEATLAHWASEFGPDARIVSWRVERTKPGLAGELIVRGSSSVAHDRYERLVTIVLSAPAEAHPDAIHSRGHAIGSEVNVHGTVPDIEGVIRTGVEADSSIGAFCTFYDQRRAEEMARAQGDSRRVEAVGMQYQPQLAAEMVAVRGQLFDELSGTVELQFGNSNPYRLEVAILPHARTIVAEPARAVCVLTHRWLPVACLGECAITGAQALRHLLGVSERTGRLALEEHIGRCDASGRNLLVDELAKSDVSRRVVDVALLRTSALSGKRGLEDEIARCEFTDSFLLESELARSEVSGLRYRPDEEGQSAVSGLRGHHSEFVKCQSTGDVILSTEAGTSSLSGRTVRKDLLIPSQKNPARFGLADEFVTCILSGRRLLSDETEVSKVSSAIADSTLMAHSDRSGLPALPSELVRCEASGVNLLPMETGVCAVTGERVDSTLLAVSDFSNRLVQGVLLYQCPETQRRGLESELGRCAVTGALVDPRQLERCSVTGEQVLRRLTVECPVTGRVVRRDKAVAAQSGRLGHPDAVRKCTWTGWTLLADESERCALTRVTLRKDELDQSGVSRAHAELIREYGGTAPPTGGAAELVQQLLVAAGHKVGRVWVKEALGTRVVAAATESSSFFGLRRRAILCFADLGTRTIIGEVAVVEIRNSKLA